MATTAYRLTVLSTHSGRDPAETLRAAGGSPEPVSGYGGLQVASGPVEAVSGEAIETALGEHAGDGFSWAWRHRQAGDRALRAVVLGNGLTPQRLANLAGEIQSHGQLVTGVRVLSESYPAVELALEGMDVPPAELTGRLQGPAEAAGVDVAVLPTAAESPHWGLLMMDMDSTLLAVECIDEIAEHAGVKDKVAAITERAMNGELDFKGSLIERVGMLEGLPENVLAEVYHERIRANPGAARLLAAAKGLGIRIAVVSGGFTFFTERLEVDLGLDFTNANVLEVADGRLTGRVVGDIVDGAVKAATLRDLRDRLGLAREQLIAMGDGANDLPMIAEAGLGVAFHAKPRVRTQAPYNLVHSSLDGLLYLLGLSDADIQRHSGHGGEAGNS
jgi:phosphoserine phosphatase